MDPHLRSIIFLLLALLLILLVGLTVTQLLLLKRLKRSLKRELRAKADREEVVSFLNRFATSMVSTSDPVTWLNMVGSYVATAISARGLIIYTLQNDDQLRPASITGEMPDMAGGSSTSMSSCARILKELQRDTLSIGGGKIGEVMLSGRNLIESNLDRNHPGQGRDGSGIESFMVVPMSVDQENVGVICAVNKRGSGQEFDRDDLYLLESLAHQVALGSHLIQFYEQFSEQQRIQQDLKLARDIQMSLLPPRPPEGKRLKVNAVNIPAREVSGDFYDFIPLDDDNMMVIVADASGKGVPACLLMAMCRTFLRTNAHRYRGDLEGLMKELNKSLYHDTDGHQFITLAVCLVDKHDNTIEYARAGHTELLIRSPMGDVQVISPEGAALGLLPPDLDPQFDTFSFSWLPGMSILMFTDGITEALSPGEEEFGLHRLVEAWKQQDADPIAATEGLLLEVHEFTESNILSDDQTIVVLNRPGDTPTGQFFRANPRPTF